MRNTLLPASSTKISYGIREIVSKGYELERNGIPVFWENIGDPIQKGVRLPTWIKDIISAKTAQDESYGYCESKGLASTRRYLAELTNTRGGIRITEDDITFFNGLGDAIARVYSQLDPNSRILLPSPTYPAHSSAERSRIKCEPLTYQLDPNSNWMPDLNEIRTLVERHENISGILLINPDNPTSTVYSRSILEGIVEIARSNGLFIIVDEIYENLVYEGQMTRLSEVIGNDVPAIAMKGISKEIPWPGSRCGWLEYYNRSADADFFAFCEKLDQCKMSEVCSTTLPQAVIPEIMSHPEYSALLSARSKTIAGRMKKLREVISEIPGVNCNGGGGAFYATIHFDPKTFEVPLPVHFFTPEQTRFFNSWVKPDDKADLKFVYYMLAGFGICSVPLSGFNSKIPGFRITLLEETVERYVEMLNKLKNALESVQVPSIPVANL
jgi:alanine-synthesizing transaminase